jgi:IS30 family transposase
MFWAAYLIFYVTERNMCIIHHPESNIQRAERKNSRSTQPGGIHIVYVTQHRILNVLSAIFNIPRRCMSYALYSTNH